MMTLYGYWRSSASYRLRIALGLKGIEVNHVAVNLKDGEHLKKAHRARNPQSFVPVLELADGTRLTQSLAILEFLDETYPDYPLLPTAPVLRARIRAAGYIIGSDTAPVQNLRVLKYLRAELGQDTSSVTAWAQHFIGAGFQSLETLVSLNSTPTEYLFTDRPGYAECFLVPQIYNARRFGLDMTLYPRLAQVEAMCQTLEPFIQAKPENQHDATE